MNCWSHRPKSSRTSHSIDKPLFIRWWAGLFVFTIWSATELKKIYLGEGWHLDPPNIYTMVTPLDIWQRWARPSPAQRQPTRESTIRIWQLCHVTEHSKSHIWDRTLRSTEIKIPYMGPNRIPLKRLNISFVTMITKMKLRWRVEHTQTHTHTHTHTPRSHSLV